MERSTEYLAVHPDNQVPRSCEFSGCTLECVHSGTIEASGPVCSCFRWLRPGLSRDLAPDGQNPEVSWWLPARGFPAWAAQQRPLWHIPGADEVALGQELVQAHFVGALEDVRFLSSKGGDRAPPPPNPSVDRDAWRVSLLRLSFSLSGLQACLPDFELPSGAEEGAGESVPGVVGTPRVHLGGPALRSEAAAALHSAYE